MTRRACLILACALAFSCSCALKSSPPIDDVRGFTEKGVASWYGGKFHGRRTASGEIYDMHALTAAHKRLPFGTVVRVVNAKNGKTVTVRINDRGPFVRGRIIDLSYEAARRLEMIADGVVPVRIEVVR